MKYLGIDVGSISTDIVVIDENLNLLSGLYLPTSGDPIGAVKEGFAILKDEFSTNEIKGVGTTGSARYLIGAVVGADIIKNEITAHAMASINIKPTVHTIIEIGGQDSKLIIIRDGIVVDFGMNTICAAGTGSFIDHQAQRLGIKVEEFGDIAIKSKNPVRIAGRCTVFAESDMIHKQQLGYRKEDILFGLCEALVRNYLSNIGKGKELLAPIFFQGGVAANKGIKAAFEKALGEELIVPPNFALMGALGVAILAKDTVKSNAVETKFRGFNIEENNIKTRGFTCKSCPNLCEVMEIFLNNKLITCLGGRCGKWENIAIHKT